MGEEMGRVAEAWEHAEQHVDHLEKTRQQLDDRLEQARKIQQDTAFQQEMDRENRKILQKESQKQPEEDRQQLHGLNKQAVETRREFDIAALERRFEEERHKYDSEEAQKREKLAEEEKKLQQREEDAKRLEDEARRRLEEQRKSHWKLGEEIRRRVVEDAQQKHMSETLDAKREREERER